MTFKKISKSSSRRLLAKGNHHNTLRVLTQIKQNAKRFFSEEKKLVFYFVLCPLIRIFAMSMHKYVS